MDKEKLFFRAAEIGTDLVLRHGRGFFESRELGALSLVSAISQSIGGIERLNIGRYPEEAEWINKIAGTGFYETAIDKLRKKENG